jgi:Protein of unknwon function (DUF3310)
MRCPHCNREIDSARFGVFMSPLKAALVDEISAAGYLGISSQSLIACLIGLNTNAARQKEWDPDDQITPQGAVSDPINHPPHYTGHPSGVECITVVEHMGFNLGNAVKYIWRADLKGDAIEDLKKARWYIDREISKRERPGI